MATSRSVPLLAAPSKHLRRWPGRMRMPRRSPPSAWRRFMETLRHPVSGWRAMRTPAVR